METLTLKIKNNEKLNFFLELIRNFDFVEIVGQETTKEEIISDIKEAVQEMNLIKQGKMEAQLAKDFLNEL